MYSRHHTAQLEAASRDWSIQLTAQEQLLEEQRAIHRKEELRLMHVVKNLQHQLAVAEKGLEELKVLYDFIFSDFILLLLTFLFNYLLTCTCVYLFSHKKIKK